MQNSQELQVVNSIHDFLNALRIMDEPILAFGAPEIKLYTDRNIDEWSELVNKALRAAQEKSEIVKVQGNHIFLDYQRMNKAQRKQAKEIKRLNTEC